MIVLDTHSWIWWLSAPEKLSRKAQKLIERNLGDVQVRVSSISVWETVMLLARARLSFETDFPGWRSVALTVTGVKFHAVDNAITYQAVNLPGAFHADPDPADRMIVATAMGLGATLVSGDRKIQEYSYVKAIW